MIGGNKSEQFGALIRSFDEYNETSGHIRPVAAPAAQQSKRRTDPSEEWTVADNEVEDDNTPTSPLPGFISMEDMRRLLEGFDLRGATVLVVFDLTRRTVDADGVIEPLDLNETRTVERLAEDRGAVVSRGELACAIAPTKRVGHRRVDVVVAQLRAKLGTHSDAIEAHYGRGYSLRRGPDIVVRVFKT